jgi:methoxymalonate biosynthesis acyl carrier protein
MNDSNYHTIADTVRNFLVSHIRVEHLPDDENFLEKGYVNSLFAMQLVLYIENEFLIKVESEDMEIANFSSIRAITNFVASKKNAERLQ